MNRLLGLTIGLLSTTLLALAADPPKVGDPAPDVPLSATQISSLKKDADKVSLKDLKGKVVVLFYYPKADTPGCTKESCGFRDLKKEFDALGVVVIGFSSDKLEAQTKFTEKYNLTTPLFADPEKKLMTALGVKTRSTWVIDKEGKIAKIYDKVNPEKHPAEVLEFVKTLAK